MVRTPQDFNNSFYTINGGKKERIRKKRRRPGTWPVISVGRGPDKTMWAGPTFTLKDRAKAAKSGSKYEDLFSNFQRLRPKTVTLSLRHQSVRRMLPKDFGNGYTLFISRDLLIWTYDRVDRGQRVISASITYHSLELALDVYNNEKILYKEHVFLPLTQPTES